VVLELVLVLALVSGLGLELVLVQELAPVPVLV